MGRESGNEKGMKREAESAACAPGLLHVPMFRYECEGLGLPGKSEQI